MSEGPGIAVVGMAGRFPGARDLGELWVNLRRGVESIAVFQPEEMQAAGVDPARLADPRWVGAGGVLDEADRFDAAFFHFTPREAEILDPQHRLFLESCWEALEDAGCDPGRFQGAIGVFGGASLNTYLLHNLLPAGGSLADPQVAIASDKDFLTTRVSYKLGLTGPSLDVQTACSTSLVAVVLACQSLLNYQCDLALAGGVSVREPQRRGYLYQEQGILSPDGHCRPFDARARGTVPGSGVGVVALRRLDDALAAGDPIRAVIRGAALNNDGAAKVGYTAPSVSGQAEVIGLALAIAGVDPGEVSFIETHGTATPLGDPIEVRALERVFAGPDRPRRSCALGSVKSNLGHLDAAAGVAGLIKTVLALEHREIPPTLHFERPNPEIDLDAGPFWVNSRLEPWEPAGPRRAGVSSFGIGGTNAHVVLEEAPPREAPAEVAAEPELLVLSARTAPALERAAQRLARPLAASPAPRLADVAVTLRLGRRPMEVRRCLVAASPAEAAAILTGEEANRALTASPPAGERSVVFLFPGQGAQHAGMAAGLYERERAFREAFDACREVLEPGLGLDLRRALDPEDAGAADRLAETAVAQPALFAVEYALAKLWLSWGVRPAAVLGHSLGELTAACVAGVFSLPAALRLVARRGRLMQSLPAGAMLAVPLPEEQLRPWLDGGVELAAVNAPDRCVASGPPPAVAALQERLRARGIEAHLLQVRRAFHSADLEPILAAFTEEVRQAGPAPPEIPWLANLTGGWATPERAVDPAAWSESLRRPVRFSPAVAELLRDPRRVLLEVGPGRTLASLVRRHGGEAVSSLPHPEAGATARAGLLEALGRLWLAGVEVDWNGLESSGRRVPLPTYPFERRRYWVEPPRGPAAGPAARPAGPVLQAPLWRQALPAPARPNLRNEGAAWLVIGDEGRTSAPLVQRLQAERLEPAVAVPGPGLSRLAAGAFTLDPESVEDLEALLAAVTEEKRPLRIVHLAGRGFAQLAAALGRRPAVRVDVILSGAAEPAGGPPRDPEQAALLGTCAALPACRVLDVEPPPPPESPAALPWAGRLLAELGAPFQDGTVVALRGGRRWREVWEDVAPAPPRRTRALDDAEIGRLAEAALAEAQPQPAARVAAATDPLCTSHFLHYLRESGVDTAASAGISLSELRGRLRLLPRYEKLLGSFLRALREDGLAAMDGAGDGAVRFLPAAAEVPPPVEVRRKLEAAFPGFRALYDLIDHCARHYPAVLAGEIPGLAVLYPEGSSDLLAEAVRRSEGRDAAPLLLREVLAAAARQRPLRILEIGAGHGTLTSVLLPALAGSDLEYWFTDVGRAFVLRAERRAREAGQGFLRFGTLDVARDPAAQGFEPESFDAVLGADVVHATPRIARTLGHLRSLLAPGGLLGLVETVRPQRWGTLVWGLADGWWSFADEDLRRDSPLLGPGVWEEVLARCGFTAARAWLGESGSALLLARRPAAPPAGLRFVRSLAEARALASAPPASPARLVTADPAVHRYLAALAETWGRQGILALLWEGRDGGEEIGAACEILESLGATAARLSGPPEAAVEERIEAAREPRAQPLPDAIHDRPALRNPYVAPGDDTEQAVAEIWRRALGIERIGAHDNFLELGGDSLIGLQVVHAVQSRFGLANRTFSIYEHPTVAAIARFIAGEAGAADPFASRSTRGEQRRDRRASFQRMRS